MGNTRLPLFEPKLVGRRSHGYDAAAILPVTGAPNDNTLGALGQLVHADTEASKKRELLSTIVGGIDHDIERIFLSLPPDKLECLFRRYGGLYGSGKLSYARNTYSHWKSGRIRMSGMVVARLLKLVPLVLDAADRFELVQKLRRAYFRKEHVEISCTPSNWFKIVPRAVDALVDYSNRFELPSELIEKLQWLMDGDAAAAQQLLAATEIGEAEVRTQFLAREYACIRLMLSNMKGASCVTHSIELPQGIVTVTIAPPKFSILQRVSWSPLNEVGKKRILTIICKNPDCWPAVEKLTHRL